MTAADRVHALRSVLDLDGPIDDLVTRLRSFPWDSADVLVVLKPQQVIALLERYLNGSVRQADLEKWAETIEGRDDVGYDVKEEELLREIVFELANPLLTQQIDNEKAREWREKLRKVD
jgi:hypothetical protein